MSKSKTHDLLYIMNPRCGWCTKADPVVAELVKEGYDITTLDVSNPEDAERANSAKSKHNAQCGTPLFLDAETGNMACGFREKDVLEKWAKGEEMPAPPKPPVNPKKSLPARKLAKLEYIWVDGTEEKQIRSKTRYITLNFGTEENGDDTPHETNTRAKLREIVDELPEPNDFWFGLEQEYVFMDSSSGLVHGWEDGEPEPQGDYYCGNGGRNVINSQRQVVETHAQFCISSGINVGGTNAEVMKSQWEYQVGPGPSISLADQLWVSRHILNRLAEVRDMHISYEPKPADGDWNGSGCHINISTKKSRTEGGKEYIEDLCKLLEESHDKHIEVYGSGNENRLTGKHETASIDEFSWSDCDRTVSVRVPLSTVKNDYRGHIEDRRPSANVDPYEAFSVIIETLSVTENELVEA